MESAASARFVTSPFSAPRPMIVIIKSYPFASFFSDSIKQIEEKGNQIAPIGGDCRTEDSVGGIADQQQLQTRLDKHRDQHGKRSTLCKPHGGETGGKRIDGGKRCGGHAAQP